MRARAASLFKQIFATLVAIALCVPVLYSLVLLVAQPAPPTYSLDAITSALGSGSAIGELDVRLAPPPSPSQQDVSDRALSLVLADRLGVEPTAVRLVLGSNVHLTAGAIDEMPDQIIGDFTAALRMNDGTWRVVQSSSNEIEWQYALWLVAALAAAIAFIAIRRARPQDVSARRGA